MRMPVMALEGPSVETVIPYLEEVNRSGRFSNFGPLVKRLEARIAELLSCDPENVVTFSSATQAITASTQCLGLGEVTVPDFTFPGTVAAAAQGTGRVNLVDVESESWMPCQEKLGPGSILVWPFGSAPVAPRLTRGPSIVDAAASLATVLLGGLPDLGQDVTVFSLHATKLLGAGEGGLAVCKSTELASALREWTNFGFDQNRIATFIGSNAKLSEYGAAFQLARLDSRESILADWRRLNTIARSYSIQAGIAPPDHVLDCISPYWIVEFGSPRETERVEAHLTSVGVETRRWWASCSSLPAFSKFARDECLVSNELVLKTLGLPIQLGQTNQEFDFVAKSVEEALSG